MFEIVPFFCCVQITLFHCHCHCHCHWVIINLFIDMYFIARHGTTIPITYPHNIVDIVISGHHL